MSVSFQSRSISSRSNGTRGFSLVELLISISIIGIITSLVLVKFTDFDSTTILKGVAYEVAATVREAQVLSISVLGAGSDFRRTYGVHFELAAKEFEIFSDIADKNIPIYNGGESVTTHSLSRGILVEDICITLTTGDVCDLDLVDISFRRPEFASLVYAKKGANTYNTEDDGIQDVTIKLKSDKGENVWTVIVGVLGHIAVIKNP